MVRKIRVSRNGLTQCPSCSTHIKVASVVTETTCPFCQTTLSTVRDEAAGMLKSMTDSMVATRSGLIAASLMGLTAVGCGSDGETTTPIEDTSAEVQQDVQEDVPVLPPYGIPPDDVFEPEDVQEDVAADIQVQPTDVEPADSIAMPDAKPTDVAQPNDSVEPDIPVMPPYGIPPDDVIEPPEPTDAGAMDDSADAAVVDTSDTVVITPLYGLPPQDIIEPKDSTDETSDASDASDGDNSQIDAQAKDVKPSDAPIPVPLYGAPPPPKDAS